MVSAQLSYTLYAGSCPKGLSTSKSVGDSVVSSEVHDTWLLLDYIVRLLSVLIFLNLVPTHDPWSSMNSYQVSFNDNETLQSPEERPDEQHLRVVVIGSNIEGNSVRRFVSAFWWDKTEKSKAGEGEPKKGGTRVG
nr:hypothetical protein CFP56_52621 [Quercus suber]